MDASNEAITIAASGRRRTDTIAAPMHTATPAASGKPGTCEAMIPAAAPRKRAGNTGPPRKLPSEIAYASPLKTISSASAESDQLPACAISPGSWSCPENSTSSTALPLASWKAIARPETASPAIGSASRGRALTTR